MNIASMTAGRTRTMSARGPRDPAASGRRRLSSDRSRPRRPGPGAAAGQCQTPGALVLGETPPDPVRLLNLQCMGTAFDDDRAIGTDGLGRGFAAPAAWAPLGVRTEEDGAVHPPAFGVQLPLPQVLRASRKSPGICHLYPHHLRRRAGATQQGCWRTSCCAPIGSPTPRAVPWVHDVRPA